ncbi:MAG: hypothetical protein ACRDP9_18725 [Kribbellaceae bacterium]
MFNAVFAAAIFVVPDASGSFIDPDESRTSTIFPRDSSADAGAGPTSMPAITMVIPSSASTNRRGRTDIPRMQSSIGGNTVVTLRRHCATRLRINTLLREAAADAHSSLVNTAGMTRHRSEPMATAACAFEVCARIGKKVCALPGIGGLHVG